ncbi:MAG: EVE domain-containing protein [Patescibacteria group bacterium]
MAYFLAKTDPGTYSIEDFERDVVTEWDGVHNYEAINYIKTMRPGDVVYIYLSQTAKAILGLAEVVGEPYENKSDPRFSWAVRLKFIKRTKPVTLSEVKADPSLKKFKLVTHSRLSVMAVDDKVAAWINPRL